MIINAFIQGQSLKLPRPKIVAGANDYHEMQIVLQTGDWSGLDIWGHFTRDGHNIYDVHAVDCHVGKDQHLNLSAGEWKVYFSGMDLEGTERITTEQQPLTVQATGCICGPFPTVPLSHAEKITQEAGKARKLAEETRKIVVDNAPLTERAETAAQNAEASAQQAATSAAKSAGSAGQATQSAGAAQQAREKAEAAAQTATSAQESAKGSMDAAGLSAQQAGRDASEAANSAAQAEQAQTAAAAAAGQAAGNATSAAQSAESARRDAQSAEDDAGFAKASQEAAATSEANASNSAGAALSYSEAAGASADQAQTDALTAQEASQTATSKAAEAKKEADRAAEEAGKIPQIQDIYNTAVEAFCPVFEKSGPVVVCNPVTRIPYPLSVKSQIVPRQEGSGDPSPENVRPILPTEKVELVRCGKAVIGCTPRSPKVTAKFPAGTVFSAISNPNTPNNGGNFRITYADGTVFWLGIDKGENFKKFKPTTKETAYIENLLASESNYMLYVGDKPEPYEPYTGSTYTAQLPPDTYGGEVDWEKKELIKREMCDLLTQADPKIGIVADMGTVVRSGFQMKTPEGFPQGSDKNNAIFSHFPYVKAGYGADKVQAMLSRDTITLWIPKNLLSDVSQDAVVEWLTAQEKVGTPVKCVYTAPNKPAPITPSATPAPIPGVNTLYSDTGDTTVSGREDPVATFENQQAQIDELKKAIITTGGNV